MLKQRVLTALILVPLVILAIFKLANPYFALLMGLVVLAGAWEWSNFIPCKNLWARLAMVAVTGILVYLLYTKGTVSSQQGVIGLAVIWWALCLYLLAVFPFADAHWMQKAVARTVIGIVVLMGTFTGMVLLHHNPNYGPQYILYLMVLIWTADSGAYFAGRRFGKRKLNPQVSPGKSWEGVYGALAMTVLVTVIACYGLGIGARFPLAFIALSIIVVAISIVGDLAESMFKRMVNIKDSGQLLPGHGGILDRIDSLTSAAPVFVAGLMLLERLL